MTNPRNRHPCPSSTPRRFCGSKQTRRTDASTTTTCTVEVQEWRGGGKGKTTFAAVAWEVPDRFFTQKEYEKRLADIERAAIERTMKVWEREGDGHSIVCAGAARGSVGHDDAQHKGRRGDDCAQTARWGRGLGRRDEGHCSGEAEEGARPGGDRVGAGAAEEGTRRQRGTTRRRTRTRGGNRAVAARRVRPAADLCRTQHRRCGTTAACGAAAAGRRRYGDGRRRRDTADTGPKFTAMPTRSGPSIFATRKERREWERKGTAEVGTRSRRICRGQDGEAGAARGRRGGRHSDA